MQSVRYYGFVDPSGGSADSMTLATGHREDDIVVVDALREIKPPFSPESAVAEFSELLKSYHVIKITGDRYAGEWPRERFREHGIVYEPAQKPKSDLYRDLLPAINSRKLDLESVEYRWKLVDDRMVMAMGFELASIHRGTRGKKAELLADLEKRTAKELQEAIERVAANIDRERALYAYCAPSATPNRTRARQKQSVR